MSGNPADPGHGGPTPLPTPEGFPVAWEQPGDELLLWEREKMHMPHHSTAMDVWVQRHAIGGALQAFVNYAMPVRMRVASFNGWIFQAVSPVSFDHAELESLGRTAMGRIGERVGRLTETWEGEWLPQIRETTAFWDAFALAEATDEALVAHVDQTIERFDAVWHVHFQLVIPMLFAMSTYQDAYHRLLGGETFEPFTLLQGLPNKSVEADTALFALARRAASTAEVHAAFGADDVLASLDTTAAGREFRTELDDYLDEYGRRADGFLYVSLPSWREDPSVVLSSIAEHLTSPDHDPTADQQRLSTEREEAVASARARLANATEEERGEFEHLLKAAQAGSVLQEDHNFWLDCQVVYAVRRIALELGRRLVAAGALSSSSDVFHLDLEEARDALGADPAQVRETVEQRRAELARFADNEGPPVLGALPPGPPPADPIATTIMKMFGAPPAEARAADELPGLAGSPGVVRGHARVVTALTDAERLRDGEILVAAMTSPPWTPLFGIAGGVVTDTGGILCHCAVVAREYAIPAVVGARGATARIRDGDLIEVDGGEGVVRILVSTS